MQTRRIDGARSFDRGSRHTLLCIGNFDGVHTGHRAVLGAASAEARARDLELLVLTFHPHPAEILGRGRLSVLTPLERKVELLCRTDASLRVVVEPFTQELSRTTARVFAEDLLAARLGARIVVVGQNFRFGQGRAGDLALLEALGRELGFSARAQPLAGDAGGTFSSSRIRAAIAAGDVQQAESLLGRPHALTGTVVRGDGRGRTIGFPTANLTGIEEALPPHGVYACLVDRLDGSARRLSTGVVNVGVRPTVAAGFSVEAHLHDSGEDLYGARLRLHLVARLRDERKFASVEALTTQIRADVEAARVATAGRAPDPAAGGAWY